MSADVMRIKADDCILDCRLITMQDTIISCYYQRTSMYLSA